MRDYCADDEKRCVMRCKSKNDATSRGRNCGEHAVWRAMHRRSDETTGVRGRMKNYSENSFSKRDTSPTGLNADHRLPRDELDPREFMRRSML